jgi:DNA-binding response OmpR family regulator
MNYSRVPKLDRRLLVGFFHYARGMEKRTVLIIDDEEDFGLLLKKFFTKKDYEVFFTKTLADGLALLENVNPDYIFLDNNLPDGRGWNLKESLIKRFPNTHLSLISSDPYEGVNHPSMDFLEKPISTADLDRIFG